MTFPTDWGKPDRPPDRQRHEERREHDCPDCTHLALYEYEDWLAPDGETVEWFRARVHRSDEAPMWSEWAPTARVHGRLPSLRDIVIEEVGREPRVVVGLEDD